MPLTGPNTAASMPRVANVTQEDDMTDIAQVPQQGANVTVLCVDVPPAGIYENATGACPQLAQCMLGVNVLWG